MKQKSRIKTPPRKLNAHLAVGLVCHLCSQQPDTNIRREFPGSGLVT